MPAQGIALGIESPSPEVQALKGPQQVRRLVEDSPAARGRWIRCLIARPRALRGQSCSALSGREILTPIVDPRAMPWAIMSLPRWGEIHIAQLQKAPGEAGYFSRGVSSGRGELGYAESHGRC